jgi:hypothetical protein
MLANMLENVRGGMLSNGSHRLTINKHTTPNVPAVMCLYIKGLCLGIKYLDIKVYVSTSR